MQTSNRGSLEEHRMTENSLILRSLLDLILSRDISQLTDICCSTELLKRLYNTTYDWYYDLGDLTNR